MKVELEDVKMALQECGNGHIYDTDQYASCPYCVGGNRINFGADSGIGKTVATSSVVNSEIGATIAPATYRNKPAESDTGKTVGVFQKKMSFEPIVGWLVCVEGPEKGKDYRIYGRNNTIGRSEKMDICLTGDTSISRENHARLAYDKKHNAFHIIPADGTNAVYLNDEPVYVPMVMKANDILEIGDYRLCFVPFCNENFVWDSEKKDGNN